VLLGGGAFGELVERCDRESLLHGRSGLLVLVLIALLTAVFAQVIMIGRIDDAIDQSQAVFEAAATFILAIIPLTLAAYALSKSERPEASPISIGAVILLAGSVVLGAYTLRTTVMLSFFNADTSIELLAQRTSTPAVHELVKRVTNLSRDATLTQGSAADPEGGHSLSIAIDRSVQYPYRWYFREFPEATVVSEGQAPTTGADVVITPDEAGLPEAGYTPRNYPAINRVPGVYLAPDIADIIRGIVMPSRWLDSVHYLLFREMSSTAEPENVTLGLTGALSNRISPDTGPFSLYEQVGAGNGRGQFNQPRGIAITDDGEQIYVVDMGNARVQHFAADGEFVDAWGGDEDAGVTFARTDSGLGPTGIAVGSDGLIYVCDTWEHRVVVLDESGRLVREFGSFADTLDAPDSSPEPGRFFGPRDVLVYNDEIYVVDTGNERVQVFALDGTFLRSWGGNGSEPGQLVEPVGIAVDSQGRIFVADSGNARISVFTTDGTPIEQWPVDAWFGNQYFEPYLAFDDAGNLYASSSATASIEVFNSTGTLTSAITDVNGDVLEQPVGLEWSPQGELLVTDKATNAAYQYVPPLDLESDEVTGGIIGDEPGTVETLDSGSPATSADIATPEASPDDSAPIPPDSLSSPVAPAESSPQAILEEPAGASPQASPVGSPVASPVASPAASPNPGGNG
jgi:DNA-binding beta-propeller fold protein YncE